MVLKNIALTGGSGLLGRHLAFVLLKNNYRVIASSRKSIPFKNKNLIWKKIDFNKEFNQKILDKNFSSVSTIIHAGAYVPSKKNKTNFNYIKKCNVDSSIEIAKWATKRNIHFIYISGAIVYRNENRKNLEKSKILNYSNNAYRNSKIYSRNELIV